jgi:hypothetical protein
MQAPQNLPVGFLDFTRHVHPNGVFELSLARGSREARATAAVARVCHFLCAHARRDAEIGGQIRSRQKGRLAQASDLVRVSGHPSALIICRG